MTSTNKMNNDDIYKNRDLMLGEIHKSVMSTEEWCKEHDKKDDKRFMWGAIAIIMIALATGVLPELIKMVHIG